MLTALRHPACAGQQRRLSGHGQPLTDDSESHKSPERERRDDAPMRLSRWFTIPRLAPGACIGRVAPFDCRSRCPARASGRRPWPGGMAGCHAQHQKPEVSKRLTLDGHSPVTAARCHVSREASTVPAARELPGPAACRWCWRRATSCRWRSAAEVRRASAAWPAASGWSPPACPAETGCSTAGPGC